MSRKEDCGTVVTGYGCHCAAGASANSCAESIMSGQRHIAVDSGVTNAQGTTFPVFPTHPNALPSTYFELPESMRCGELAVEAAHEAIRHSGLDLTWLKGVRVGVCIGTTAGNSLNNDPFYGNYLAGTFPDVQAMLGYRAANPAAYVAKALGVSGPCLTITNACSSGSLAIGEARQWLREGRCDVVLAGGAEKLCPIICHGFASLLIADAHPCRPFDASRKGLNLGEGAGMMVLESDAACRARGATSYARLTGYGNRSDAYHLSAPDPQGSGLREAMVEALNESGIRADDLAFILAHGTGTQENDAMEMAVFADMIPSGPFFSVKGCTGHTLGAAGAIEAVLTVIYLNGGTIPGSAGFDRAPSDARVIPTTEPTDVTGNYALSNSIAFGGNAGVLVFKRGDA